MANKYAKLYTLRSDGRYMGYWHDSKGVRHSIYDKDPEKLYHKIAEKEKPKAATFGDMADIWEREAMERLEARTWNNYKARLDALRAVFGDREVMDISAAEIASRLQGLKAQNFSATVIKTEHTILNQIFDVAILKEAVKFNIARTLKNPRQMKAGKRRAPTDAEIDAILRNRDGFGFFPFFLLCTGLRKSEALALTVNDIDLKNRRICVNKALTYLSNSRPEVKQPKTEAGNREVPIIDILYEPLVSHLKAVRTVLFPNDSRKHGGEYWPEHAYEGAWEAWRKKAGLPEDLTAHCLRHGTATLLFENDVDVYSAKNILGHAQITTTMAIYTELREAQKKKSDDKMSKMLSDRA